MIWFLRQLMQWSLLYLWMAIYKDWCGFKIFKHGDINQNAENGGEAQPVVQVVDGGGNVAAAVGGAGPLQYPNVAQQQNQNADGGANLNGNQRREHDEDDEHQRLIDENNGDNIDDQVVEYVDENGVRRRRINFPPRPVIQRPPPRRQKKYTWLLYFPPAFFDVTSVLLVYFGMELTYSSSFCLFKGTVAFFTTLLCVAFLAQQFAIYVWVGVVFATLGVGSLGISDYVKQNTLSNEFEAYGIAAGDLQIVMGQIMFATKLIYEEKFIRKHSIHPMKFLGSEASYGLFFSFLLLLIFNFVDGVQYTEMPNGNIEDVVDACWQIAADWRVALAFSGSLVCFLVYTYLGVFLVRDLGALPRVMIELITWTLYWGVCVGVGWEDFYKQAQIPGFVVIVLALLLYARILVVPFMNFVPCRKKNDDVVEPDDEPQADDVGMLNVINADPPLVGNDGDDEPLVG